MAHLARRTYRPRPPYHTLFDGKPTAAAVSPVHLVFMHGLCGNNRNFSSLCTSMAGLDSDQRLTSEAKTALMDCQEITLPGHSAKAPVPKPAAARVYTCTAFDWRNHGDSPHNACMGLKSLSEDLFDYLMAYSTHLRYEQLQVTKQSAGVECVPVDAGAPSAPPQATEGEHATGSPPPGEPLPLLLVAHSMGAMGLMHWMWREHVNIWAHKVSLGGESPYLRSNVFSNPSYRVIGAVIIDMAPAERPDSFNETIRIIDFLPKVPLHELRSPQEVEKWLLANGPSDVFNQQHIFQIRYHLSNLDYTNPAQPRWRIGLQEIVHGLHEILWEEGGVDCIRQARDALATANRRRVTEHKRIWERPTRFTEFPTYFVFGENSPYNTERAHQSIFLHFQQPNLVEMKKADHFMFMRHKNSFMEQLRRFCYDAEVKARLIS